MADDKRFEPMRGISRNCRLPERQPDLVVMAQSRADVLTTPALFLRHPAPRGLAFPVAHGLTASSEQHADLFWAARGAGAGFFGVVTCYHLELYRLAADVIINESRTALFAA